METVAWRCSLKKVFLKISQFIKKDILAQVFSCEFPDVFREQRKGALGINELI